ncbi:MAG: hypothetical protein ACX930_00205 [Erythrobacter sp.]
MSPTEIFFIAGVLGGLVAFIAILAQKQPTGSPLIAAMLCAAFTGYTAVQLWSEGPAMFWVNHSQNLTGIQVWWDLIISVLVALFFVVPRARKVGMNVPLWAVAVIATASIGLLAMCARLFWLEQATPTTEGQKATA